MPTRLADRCLWLRQAIAPHETDAPALKGAVKADICIVGGGYAGLWTALELKRRNPALDVVIVEADICGGGASGRNTGMVLPLWMKFEPLRQLCGDEGALRLCRASASIVGEIGAFCRAHDIDAEIRPDEWLWAATCGPQVGAWRPVMQALARHGEAPFREVSQAELDAIVGARTLRAGAIMGGTATLHPGRLVRGLRKAALDAGVRVFENSPMARLDRKAPAVHTQAGSVAADRVILAMNAWSAALPELRPAILVIASDDAATAPVPDLLRRCRYESGPLVTDSQTFVSGFRSTADGRIVAGVTGGAIGFGGLDGRRFEGRSPRAGDIANAVRRIFPALGEAPLTESWRGPIDRTQSGLPLFGKLPGAPAVLYGFGFSGNGITTTPLAARILASLAEDRVDEWSACGLVRPPIAWLPPEPFRYLGALMVRTAVRRKDRLGLQERKPGPIVRRLAALAPGGIVTTGGLDPTGRTP